MELLRQFIWCFTHLREALEQGATSVGATPLYCLLALIVFCETGLVVTPFLPGDSLLFALGALTAQPDFPLRAVPAALLLIAAAILGDAVNYAIGARVGPRVFTREDSRWLKKRHLIQAQRFYERHGGKAIVLARFVPIIRTFAPFVAGIGTMRYRRFAIFNVSGAVAWVSIFIGAGYAFGNLPQVKRNFQYVILGIIVVSVIPVVVEYLKARNAADDADPQSAAPSDVAP